VRADFAGTLVKDFRIDGTTLDAASVADAVAGWVKDVGHR
jgi:hypothetical protein